MACQRVRFYGRQFFWITLVPCPQIANDANKRTNDLRKPAMRQQIKSRPFGAFLRLQSQPASAALCVGSPLLPTTITSPWGAAALSIG